MFRLPANFCWLLLFAALSGCAHHPDVRSVRHKQAMDWARQGEKAYLGGNVEQSRQYYEKALQLNRSIENTNGIAANLLSLAQIHLERGEYEQAEANLQVISGNKNNLFMTGVRAEAAARSAQLALLLKQPVRAAELALQAQKLCMESVCKLEAAILNLQAQSALSLGQTQASADLARQAEAVAEQSHQVVELANAQRLLGEIHLRQATAAEAMPLLESALLLDKQLGLPKKIADDLHLLAEAKDILGQHEEANSCRDRERAIRSATGEKGP